MGKAQLSPHDEHILFRLVEFERSLPREKQSRRFNVKILSMPGMVPDALVEAAATAQVIKLKTDAECFQELAAAGCISGGSAGVSFMEGRADVRRLDVVRLMESAFQYYDEKHDFPTSLADERRELVDSKISTVYPEVVAYLKKAYDAIRSEQPEDNWSSVAHDCQDALRAFADAVYKPDYASRLCEETPSSPDFEKKLEQIIRVNTDKKELRDLLDKLNRYVNARRHDAGTTREEAKRCVLLTYLLVAEVFELLTQSGTAQKAKKG